MGKVMKMLGDLHIHMILDGVYYRAAIDSQRESPCDTLIRARLADYRTREISFLRDGGDAWGVSLRAKELAGEYGIDYRSPAFPIYLRGHYGAFIGRGFSDLSEYRALLAEVSARGGDFVKLMIAGLIDFSCPNTLTEAGMPPALIRDAIALAHDMGFAVMVHANGDLPVNAALDAQVDSIEHGAYLHEQTLARLAEGKTLWVPTLSTIGNLIGRGRYPDAVLRPLLAEQQEKVRFVVSHGGRIGLGSDAGAFRVLHGQAVTDEYGYLTQALGETADAVLHEAEDFARTTFRR